MTFMPALVLAAVLTLEAASPSATDDCIVLEDFSRARVGEFPEGWTARRAEGRPVYAVREEDGRRFLRATSRGLGVQAGVPREWDLEQYPILAWWWRPLEFPRDADERHASTNESALAVYLLMPYSGIVGPKAVKYVWSERLPTGTRLSSNMGLTQVRVLESGVARRKEWVEERVNARDDAKLYLRLPRAPIPGGIAVLTDSDDTRSSAQGDYADFRACRR
jgi:hypothetical protein